MKTGNNICEISAGDLFTQKLIVGQYLGHSWEYCKELCEGKKVIHFGCSDYPFDSPAETMHIYLSKYAKELHGCDINGIAVMKEYNNGTYFNSILEIKEEYDVILVPNIIEHLENAGVFVEQLFNISFKEIFILVPNYNVEIQSSYNEGVFTERIHPDHYAWYSPYTLYNLFKKYVSDTIVELNFFSGKDMIGILIKK